MHKSLTVVFSFNELGGIRVAECVPLHPMSNVLMIVTKVVIGDGETIETKDKSYENYENYGKIMMHCTSVKLLYVL